MAGRRCHSRAGGLLPARGVVRVFCRSFRPISQWYSYCHSYAIPLWISCQEGAALFLSELIPGLSNPRAGNGIRESVRAETHNIRQLRVHAQQGSLCLIIGEPGAGRSVLKQEETVRGALDLRRCGWWRRVAPR